ncbi:MAG: 2Fe-2S iron-sulfur cluster-binding protein [Bryobacteraceae bacterium]
MRFEFDGRPIEAKPGDTVASALYRAGQRIFSRSFKYHRPRGLLCCSGKCPNCLMQVDGTPNVRACLTPVREGMKVRHQNAYPSLDNDWLSLAQAADGLMPVGWYYKVFTTQKMWHLVEPFVRRVAGLGEVPPPGATDDSYEHAFLQAEAAVIGGGPAGLQAALQHAGEGKQVVLVDDQADLGGHLRYRKNGSPAELIAAVRADARITVLSPAYCFGLFEGNLLGVVEPQPYGHCRERLVHLRAGEVVIATGVYEAPLLFENNDLVGVMLSTAVQRLIHLHDVVPGRHAVIIGEGSRAEEIASHLRGAGVELAGVAAPADVIRAEGSREVTGLRTTKGLVRCDLVVMCGHLIPDAGLLSQAGARLEWRPEAGAFVPLDLPDNVSAVGDVTGAGLTAAAPLPPPRKDPSKRAFVCVCTDATAKDLCDAVDEGFDQIETLKRYTTSTMGPCQGRMCQINAIGVCASKTGRPMGETGTTTSRPPNPGVTLGALAGARHHPIRRTPMHYDHDALNAVWFDMGEWKRPRYYRTAASGDERTCVREEYQAVRERVGIIDVSTLGKLEVKGRDAGKLLDKVYTHKFSDLPIGRARYATLCDESGVLLDDGTISRIAENHYFVTTTTGNLDFVQQWLEWWLAGTGQDVHIANVTSGMAAVNVAGPKARDTLKKLTSLDLSTKAFSYMATRRAEVAGIPAILMRIGFVGETGWEIHVPAESGPDLWKALLDAGREFGIRAFGVEAQRLLRLEKKHVIIGVDTDALTSPYQAAMGWVVRFEKEDFIGRRTLEETKALEPSDRLVGFVMDGDQIPDDGAAVMVNGRPAGRVTSSRYSPHKGAAIGMAWVPANRAHEGSLIEVRAQGLPATAHVTLEAFYDPEGARLRM